MTEFLKIRISAETPATLPINLTPTFPATSSAIDSATLPADSKDSDPLIQLRKGIPVYIKSSKLILINRFKNKPKILARLLLFELIKKEQLKTMCALGHSKSNTAVPEDIRIAILSYVQRKKTVPDEFTNEDLIKVINNTCGTLRHPKKEGDKIKKNIKKETNKKQRTEDKSNENMTSENVKNGVEDKSGGKKKYANNRKIISDSSEGEENNDINNEKENNEARKEYESHRKIIRDNTDEEESDSNNEGENSDSEDNERADDESGEEAEEED
ncbi:uncharacterized protein LOC127288123 [Leptopilina boulardi]|uniref:uncharacterized protein LOC127279043 n=1 Tax=Leptopilina boulardi TaxID=63433 RepID=UPI0021F5306C|nr:uncharacterized protein LOC127279043 [Leptopilina boulardi]XP_051159117.1 uncharacterized protein LOC127280266 [Leptopilina boulardi]XP_051171347.1 uncharacterized protein LOC127288123 [Leptopilina boulardi]